MASVKQREYEMMFSLNAKLGNAYSGTFTKAQSQINAMQRGINALSKAQRNVSAYQKQQAALEASEKKLAGLRAEYEKLQRTEEAFKNSHAENASEVGQSTVDFSEKYRILQEKIDKASSAAQTHKDKLGQMGDALKSAGIDTDKLGEASAGLASEIQKMRREQEAVANASVNFGQSASQAFISLSQVIAAAGIAKALKEIYTFFSDCADASMLFESALAGVEKTTNLSAIELNSISQEIKNLSTEIPMAANELAGIAENAGQLGIHKDSIMDFTKVMADLGVATNLSGEEAAQAFAKFANITQMPQENFDNLGSTVVALGNNLATTERDIANMAMRLASAGSQAGMSEADIIGLAGALSSVGMEAEAGGTAFSTAINHINKSVQTGGEELWNFAEIAGMTASEFSKAWEEDAASALTAFTKGLGDTERLGKSTLVLLDELEFNEIRLSDAMRRAAGSGDLFNNAIALGNKAWEENTALVKEAETRYDTTESKLVMMQNAYDELKIAVGDNYTPVLKNLYELNTDFLKSITSFVENNPAVVKALTVFIGVVGAATAGVTALTIAINAAKAAKVALGAISLGPIALATAAVAGLTAVVTGLAAAHREADEETRDLSASSLEQYYQIKDLEAEYNALADAGKETSAEAQLLKKEIDEATRAFEGNKQSVEDAKNEHKLFLDSVAEHKRAQEDLIRGVESEGDSILNLVTRLETLVGAEGKTAAAKKEILAIVEILNEKMPELALAYDEYSDSLSMTPEKIRKIAEAEVAREKSAAYYQRLIDEIKETGRLEDVRKSKLLNLENAEALLARRRKEQAEAMEAYKKALADPTGSYNGKTAYQYELEVYVIGEENVQNAENAVNSAKAELDDATKAVEDNKIAIEDASVAYAEFASSQALVNSSTTDFNTLANDTKLTLENIDAAYRVTYDAAIESVEGQYKLWDTAAKVIPNDINEIIDALESQNKYWEDYDKNLLLLQDAAGEIEGLDKLIQDLDGSAESVNFAAGLANAIKAGDIKKVEEMISQYAILKDRQDKVAQDLVELDGKFAAALAELQQNFNDTILGMDYNEEAFAAAENTIQGFIDAANDPENTELVRQAYARLAETATAALNNGRPNTGSLNSRYPEGMNPYGSHADGLFYVPFNGYIAELHEGERVLTKDEARLYNNPDAYAQETYAYKNAAQTAPFYLLAPDFINALQANHTEVNAVSAIPAPASSATMPTITFSPVFNIDAKAADNNSLRDTLSGAAYDLKRDFLRLMDDYFEDIQRNKYC